MPLLACFHMMVAVVHNHKRERQLCAEWQQWVSRGAAKG